MMMVCCLDQSPNRLVEVYINNETIMSGNINNGMFQPMSRLMYCKQVELDQSEHFITDSGIVKINVTKPMIAITDYYPISQYPRVRVCTDMYIPKAPVKSTCAIFVCSVELMILSLVSFVVIYMMN